MKKSSRLAWKFPHHLRLDLYTAPNQARKQAGECYERHRDERRA